MSLAEARFFLGDIYRIAYEPLTEEQRKDRYPAHLVSEHMDNVYLAWFGECLSLYTNLRLKELIGMDFKEFQELTMDEVEILTKKLDPIINKKAKTETELEKEIKDLGALS